MHLRLPKPKGHDKPRKRPPIVSTADAPPCGICNKQISRYTCPSCNLPYCSLACFRSQQHASCLDHFQRATLAQDLDASGDHRASLDDRNRMIDMLKKFEQQQNELEEQERRDALKDDDNDDDDGADQSPEAVARRKERHELEKRLEGIDLDVLPPEQLLSLLSPSQQAAFQATLHDPARLNKLVEDQLEGDEPWWVEEDEVRMLKDMRDTSKAAVREARTAGKAGGDAGDEEEAEDSEEDEDEDEDPQVRPPVLHPEQLPPLKVGPDGKPLVSPKLLHNIAAVLFAYAFTLRTFSLSSFASLPAQSTERTTAIQVLAQLLPFLVERSTAAFEDLGEAVEAVVAQEDQGMPSPLVALLLNDLSTLLLPTPIAPISSSPTSPLSSHALAPALHALSDVHHLFAHGAAAPPRAPPHATHQTGGTGPTVTRPLIARPAASPASSSSSSSSAAAATKRHGTRCALAAAKTRFYASVLADPQAAGAGVVEACRGLSGDARERARKGEREEEERRGRVERIGEELGRRGVGGRGLGVGVGVEGEEGEVRERAGEREGKARGGKKVAFQAEAREEEQPPPKEPGGPKIVEL